MKSVNLTRMVMGTIILGGLVFYTPVAYATAGMMVIAGLTGAWFLERAISKVLGDKAAAATAPGQSGKE